MKYKTTNKHAKIIKTKDGYYIVLKETFVIKEDELKDVVKSLKSDGFTIIKIN